MKRSSKSSLTTQYIVLFGVLLLVANTVLGVLLQRQTSAMIQTMIRKSMVSISNTAADLMDGDVLGAFTEEDVGTPAYNEVYRTLAAFQNNADIQYIYAVRQAGENLFAFTVDPDPVDPGSFGEAVTVTEAMRQAGRGHAAVDDTPVEDRWGKYYSAFSPVFDSEGKVVGVIGVDFNSEWFNQQIWNNTRFIILISLLFTLVGALGFLMINDRVRKRFIELGAELATLSSDVESLTAELLSGESRAESGAPSADAQTLSAAENSADDELRALGRKLHAMHKEMEQYLDFMHTQAYTDTLTRVGNTTAYLERQKELEARILNGSARFSAIMFDINDLKLINDRYGHACGDKAIRAAADAIVESFEQKNTFRIGGDEFIVIAEQMPYEELAQRLLRVDELIARYNATDREHQATLSIAKGCASFVLGRDHAFRDVFVRADQKMYENKARFHRGNRAPAQEEAE